MKAVSHPPSAGVEIFGAGHPVKEAGEHGRGGSGPARFRGALELPPHARGVVLFAHAGGAGLLDAIHGLLAWVLHQHRLGTLQVDLTGALREAPPGRTLHRRPGLQVERALAWLDERSEAPSPVGLLGTGSAAAAVLDAAVRRPARAAAVVLCGARSGPIAADAAKIVAPVLLIAAERDPESVRLNREVLARLGCNRRLEIVPGTADLLEAPGALESVGHLAADWFTHHMTH